jgi:hypothetical protein
MNHRMMKVVIVQHLVLMAIMRFHSNQILVHLQ